MQHASYELLNSISISSILFHTIIMNFILILSLSFFLYQYNNILTVTDKFTKWVLLLFDKFIYTAIQWTNVLLLDLIDHDWDISQQIISDYDKKILLSFWHTIFEHLNLQLLILTAYHPLTNDQSEWTNQIVEIVLHYFLTLNSDKVKWHFWCVVVNRSFTQKLHSHLSN